MTRAAALRLSLEIRVFTRHGNSLTNDLKKTDSITIIRCEVKECCIPGKK
jgi:hypothetical protein